MMSITFDLISDLHVDTWPEEFDWSGRATSPHALVLGDVAQDRELLVKTLTNLSRCYQAVFYVDGNTEHTNTYSDLGVSYQDLSHRVNGIKNVVYLQDNVVVVDGVAILGTNGWWGYDFDAGIDPEQSAMWHMENDNLNSNAVAGIRRMATTDANYMIHSVKRLQTHVDVKKIVMATHTVPMPELIAHDIDLNGKMKFNLMGNKFMQHALAVDTENKIHTWCFGHYHGSIDQTRNGIRYVNNCRGRGDRKYSNWAYHPLRITVGY
jgi:predicted phosphodiesterase